jgi:drug/metabolite transporter (DMT)-like permease
VLGALLAICSAAAFAFNNAGIRRGVLSGSVLQAMAITVPIGIPIFLFFAAVFGFLGAVWDFTPKALAVLAAAGILNFVWARYCIYRATKAIGMNLVAPLQQLNLVVTLIGAVLVLDEKLDTLRWLGIALAFLGPAITTMSEGKKAAPAAPATGGAAKPPEFKPSYTEGYTYSLLSTIGYGVTPILVSFALEGKGVGVAIAGGLVAYLAATALMGLVLLWPGNIRHAFAVKGDAAKWFGLSGLLVCLSQMFLYMAMSIAPVSVVLPISRLSILFRLYFSWLLNAEHEVFTGKVIVGTLVSLLGALVLSLSTETVQSLVSLPPWLDPILRWHWP